MHSEKLITVITTVYNKAKFLETWAKCLSEQTFLDKTKILVIEDGSTDNSLELLKKFSEQYNLPVEIICNEKNMGLLYTIRKAYRLLDTKYFAVLDADDYWLSPKKLENAVNFLEQHKDYSAYATNYFFQYSDSQKNPALAPEIPNMTFTQAEGVPFFQTSAMTFRNFFSADLLNKMDCFTYEKNFGICEGDAFRNAMAFGFGKIYFENSLDAAWRCNVGMWGTLSKLEQDLLNLSGQYELFEFYRAQFSLDNNAAYFLKMMVNFYVSSLNAVAELMRNLNFFKFKCKSYFIKLSKIIDSQNDQEIILNYFLHYGKILNDLGVVLKIE